MKIHRFTTWALTACAGLALSMAAPSAHSATLSGQLGILDLTANGGINPATGVAWKLGDQYRLVFISSVAVNPRDSAMNEISAWNAAVQAIANAANNSGTTGPDLSTVSWNIIGSSAVVDARDNTSTNPTIDPIGHGIFNMQGLVIHNNFTDLWEGIVPENRPMWTENAGQHMSDEGSQAVAWSLTGTNWNGTKHSTAFLKDATGTSGSNAIRQGRNQDGFAAGWIDANRVNSNWFSSEAFSVYGMSEPLSIIPEPSAALLIGLGGLALLRRRR